jgi:hypothetical protein
MLLLRMQPATDAKQEECVNSLEQCCCLACPLLQLHHAAATAADTTHKLAMRQEMHALTHLSSAAGSQCPMLPPIKAAAAAETPQEPQRPTPNLLLYNRDSVHSLEQCCCLTCSLLQLHYAAAASFCQQVLRLRPQHTCRHMLQNMSCNMRTACNVANCSNQAFMVCRHMLHVVCNMSHNMCNVCYSR